MKQHLLFIIISCTLVSGCAGTQHISRDAQTLTFKLYEPSATDVRFVHSANRFTPIAMTKTLPGLWETSLPPIMAEFKYFYLVDNRVYLPDCLAKEQDDFGSENCIYLPERL